MRWKRTALDKENFPLQLETSEEANMTPVTPLFQTFQKLPTGLRMEPKLPGPCPSPVPPPTTHLCVHWVPALDIPGS